MRYRADIDGLRALAILLVLIFHFDLFALGKAGFIGVDVFFVISGFLITAIIRKDLESGEFRFGTFLYRRVRRLYPALLATLVFALVAGSFLLLPHRFEELATQTLYSLLYVINFYFWQNVNYFGLQAGSVPLLHMWSLAVEEQFYFFFPLVCWGIWRWMPKLLFPTVVVGMLLSFVLGVFLTPQKPELAFYLLPTRAWELMVGSVMALMLFNKKVTGAWLHIMGPIGLLLVLASVVFYGPLTQIPGWFALLPCLGALALILGGFATEAPVTRLMSTSLLVWIGKVSYPLYLVHWPILIFVQEHTIEFTLQWRIFGFLLSFLVAALIYYVIEVPLRHGKFLAGAKAYVGSVIGVSTLTIVASFWIANSGGLPGRFDPEVNTILTYIDDTPPAQDRNCNRATQTVAGLCPLGVEGAPREVVLLGDSHAFALSEAVDLWLQEEGKGGALLFHPGCMPVLGAGRTACQTAVEQDIALIERSPEITDVMLVSIFRQGLPDSGNKYGDRWVPAEEVPEVFTIQFIKTVERLKQAGKHIILVEPLFSAPRMVPATLAGNLAFDRNWPVDISLQSHIDTFAPIKPAFDVVPELGGDRISLIDPFCADGTCRAVVDGHPLFRDRNHIAQTHSKRFATILSQQLSAD